jgi:RNA polymerase sigma-70 factor (ECF subfamily)
VQEPHLPIPELIRRARSGDAGALQALLHGCRDFVRLLIRQRCPERLRARLDGSDIVQETLLRAAQHIEQFRGEEEAAWRAWLRTIAEREVVRQVRQHLGAARRSVLGEQPLPADPGSAAHPPVLEPWQARDNSPSQEALRKERALALAGALARLPADYRSVLTLRHLEGLDFAEVAVRLDRSPGAARVLWARALKALRAEIARDFPPDSGYTHV